MHLKKMIDSLYSQLLCEPGTTLRLVTMTPESHSAVTVTLAGGACNSPLCLTRYCNQIFCYFLFSSYWSYWKKRISQESAGGLKACILGKLTDEIPDEMESGTCWNVVIPWLSLTVQTGCGCQQ